MTESLSTHNFNRLLGELVGAEPVAICEVRQGPVLEQELNDE